MPDMNFLMSNKPQFAIRMSIYFRICVTESNNDTIL